ncbi:DUF1376 domain-containing protein [Rhodanobacter hydrolyticus]|uniref:DUF1376 domain-containing protein n=1 Tax=Rhodanobacter hydrolyticus TaxID=2250595 RepID=A0ABW8J5N2_9GAMM
MTSPLVPSEVDLRGMPWMPLDTVRLIDSDLFALSTGDEFKAAVALWCKSWTQVPAASLPNDDRILAHLSGTASRWKRVKAMCMRGWVLCDDGRFYHPVIAEKALEAWKEREEFQDRQENESTRLQNFRAEHKALRRALRAHGIVLPFDTKIDVLRERVANLPETKPETETETQPETETFQNGNGCNAPAMAKTGTGTVKDQEQKASPHAPLSQDPPARPSSPTEAGRACLLMRQAGCVQTNPSHPDLLAALAEGVTPQALRDTAAEGVAAGKAKPFAWAIQTARSRHAEGASALPAGPPRTARAAAPSKTLQGIHALQELGNGHTRLDSPRDRPGLDAPRDAEP